MGFAEWFARKTKVEGKKDGNNSQEGRFEIDDGAISGVRSLPRSGRPYRDAPLTTSDLTRADLERVLNGLMEKGMVSVEDVNDEVNIVRDDTGRQARMALEERLAVRGRLLTKEQKVRLHDMVKGRFEDHNKDNNFRKARKGVEWNKVWEKLEESPEKMWSLNEMERTGGEPDVVGIDAWTGEFIFMDCSSESPVGRRNVCFNCVGQEKLARKYKNYKTPGRNAVELAAEMGVQILRKKEYRQLQKLGDFDRKTRSWVVPDGMGKNGMDNAEVVLSGSRDRGDAVVIGMVSTFNCGFSRGFRCSLRV